MAKHSLVRFSTCVCLVLASAMSASAKTEISPKSPCRIQVDQPHISTNLLRKENRRFVKVNAFSICHAPHSNVTLTVELWKEGFLINHVVARSVIYQRDAVAPGEKVANLKTYETCLNSRTTKYFGVAYSQALIGGIWHNARHKQKERIVILKCGT
jgi:exoribonuclease II